MTLRRCLFNPGTYIFLMSSWILPFFAVSVAAHPIHDNFKSYIPFFIAFVAFAGTGLIVGFLDYQTGFWKMSKLGKRCGILVAGYAVGTALALLLTVFLDYVGLVTYFGSDAAGSFGMLYIPVTLFYLVVGVVLWVVLTIIGIVMQKN